MKKLTLLLCLLGAACTNPTPPSQESIAKQSEVTIVVNALVHTVDSNTPNADGFAYQNGKIIAVGESTTIEAAYPSGRRIDANGATIVPGFIDAHGHLLGLGQSLMIADLIGTSSKGEILTILKKQEAGLADGQWLLGRGWDQNDWPVKDLPTAADLNTAFPDRPVWLERVDGHANWANQAAMALSEKDLSGAWQPDGGEIVRDESGQPTGVFIDNAVGLINSQVPVASKAEMKDALTRAMRKTASVGLTSMHDAGTSLDT